MRRILLSATLVGLSVAGCGVSPSTVMPVPAATVAQQAAPQTTVLELSEGLRYTTLELFGMSVSEYKALKALHIRTAGELLYAAAEPANRARIAAQTGIAASRLLRWVNFVDLMRVTGVGPQYSFLLEEAGVDTVPELAQRLPLNLYKALKNANKRNLVRRMPSQNEVSTWVVKAVRANRIVEY